MPLKMSSQKSHLLYLVSTAYVFLNRTFHSCESVTFFASLQYSDLPLQEFSISLVLFV